MRLAVLGPGRLGSALAGIWVQLGYDVRLGAWRDSAKAAAVAAELGCATAPVRTAVAGADALFLTVPWQAVPRVLAEAGNLTRKVLVDCTNPLESGQLIVGHTTSGAEEVARLAPAARTVKAFNTISARSLQNGERGLVLVAGDDRDAKAVVERLAREAGFPVVEAGALRVARYLEPFAALCMSLGHQPTSAVSRTS